MSRWEEFDDEAKREEKVNARLTLNFKSMIVLIEKIENETKNWDDKYPKDELMKIWLGCMIDFLFLFCFSFHVLCFVATGPLLIFQFYTLVKLYKAWKTFGYSNKYFIGITVATLAACLAAAIVVHKLIMG